MRRFVNQLATAGVFVFAALVTPDTGGAMAQPGRQGEPCDGKIVSAVEIRARGPRPADTSTVQGTLQEVERSRHTPTRHEVIAAYLRLVEGRPCTELDRSESERVLRAQPFLSYATVRTRPDGAGRVRVEVETIDELPILLGGGVRRGSVSGLMLGSGNLGGRGLTLALSYENGFHYRDGFGVRAVQYGTFGRPYTLGVTAIRHPLGESGSLVLTEPFLSDLQPRGFHTGFASAGDYYRIVRPTGEDLALYVRRMAYDFMILTRVNPVGSGGLVGLVGAAVLGEDIRTGTSTVIVSDSGLLAASAGAQFGPGFGGSSATRLAVVGGVRQVRFFTVRGFDALSAEQDVARGFQFDALAGPAVRGLSLVSDLFVSSGVYWGAGNANSFVQLRAIAEGRADTDTRSWHGVVMDGRLTWYARPSSNRTRTASLEVASIQKLGFPRQLTFRDGEGGMPGYSSATFAGGARAVARLEERRVFRPSGTFADLAIAGFAEAGQLWAGDVPYGAASGLRGALGVSVLGAYPAGGKRTYRVDFALPVRPSGGARFEVRFTAIDRTRSLLLEPNDVARSRAGAVLLNLLSWLPR